MGSEQILPKKAPLPPKETFATMPGNELREMMAQDEGLRRDWDDQYGDRMQKLVFIGQHLDQKALTEALDACLTV